MTKVTITMEIEIPDIDDCDDGDLSEMLFHEVIHPCQMSHLEHVLTWTVEKIKRDKAGESTKAAELAIEDHKLWAAILKNCKWSFTREK